MNENPDTYLKGNSINWANRMSQLSPTSCQDCVDQHGKIVGILILAGSEESEVQAHPWCKCVYVPMRTKRGDNST